MTRFAVWAPLRERVRLWLPDAVHGMRLDGRGWWHADVDGAAEPEADPLAVRGPDGEVGHDVSRTSSATG